MKTNNDVHWAVAQAVDVAVNGVVYWTVYQDRAGNGGSPPVNRTLTDFLSAADLGAP